jgi:hypothetical protein
LPNVVHAVGSSRTHRTENDISQSATSGDEWCGQALRRLIDTAALTSPGQTPALVNVISDVMRARAARLFVADYSMRFLQQLGVDGPVGATHPIAGTLIGRAFSSGQMMVSDGQPCTVSVPLTDGTERIGLLELDFDVWDDQLSALLDPLISLFVMILVTKHRYTDLWARARRSEPLSAAAEIQWDLLPPLACSTAAVALGCILEPAYSIGGDSFDYGFNDRRLDFAIVDAIGHGMPAVLMSAAAINGLRNARRAAVDLPEAYALVDRLISSQFGHSFYVTGQVGSIDVDSGLLQWVNAGHVPPLLVRNGTFAGELVCAPSMPLGLGGQVVCVASEPLQRGDRVLFYTDGITESRSADGAFFGLDRLADFLVRATLEHVPVAETVRRLSTNVVEYVGAGLNDDATLLLIEYLGAHV